jgi:hypothetical protein
MKAEFEQLGIGNEARAKSKSLWSATAMKRARRS